MLAIEAADESYLVRYGLVFRALHEALEEGYAAGINSDESMPGWPCAYIELPQGQVSWYLPAHPVEFDGHSTEEKYARIREFAGEGT